MPSLKQNLLAEFLGTMFLVTVAIASVILPFALDGSTVVLAVFINALAVAFVLFALIETFGSVSGAHFNPAVTLALLASKEIDKRKAACYIGVQLAGGFLGMLVAHLMFLGTTSTFYPDTSTLITISSNVKLPALYFAEFIGTFLLVGVIIGCVRGVQAHWTKRSPGRRRDVGHDLEHDVRQPCCDLCQDLHLCHMRHSPRERRVLHNRGDRRGHIGHVRVWHHVSVQAQGEM